MTLLLDSDSISSVFDFVGEFIIAIVTFICFVLIAANGTHLSLLSKSNNNILS